jgi:excisionase family DNA binding protein
MPTMANCPATDARKEHDAERRLITIKEFCRRYGRSRSRAYELIASRELPAVKEGRSTLIPVDGAEAWAEQLKRVATEGIHKT